MTSPNGSGAPGPEQQSAPLHPPGRKRWDPRAPYGTSPAPIPPAPPTMVPEGSASTCSNGLPYLENRVTVSGTAEPYALIKIYIDDPVMVTNQVGWDEADSTGAWSSVLSWLPKSEVCLVATQTVPGINAPSAYSTPLCIMVDTCVGLFDVPPPFITNSVNSPRNVDYGNSTPTGDCGGVSVLSNPVYQYGTASPGAVVRVYISNKGYIGSHVATATANPLGQWIAKLSPTFADGNYCTVATQQYPRSHESDPSPEECFMIGECFPPPKPVELISDYLRFDESQNWYHGTLAFKIDGVWTYGVLRKVV